MKSEVINNLIIDTRHQMMEDLLNNGKSISNIPHMSDKRMKVMYLALNFRAKYEGYNKVQSWYKKRPEQVMSLLTKLTTWSTKYIDENNDINSRRHLEKTKPKTCWVDGVKYASSKAAQRATGLTHHEIKLLQYNTPLRAE